MKIRRFVFACGAVVLAASVLAGCRAEEQGRPLIFHKGEYIGPQDTKLTESQISELNRRAGFQGDANIGAPPVAAPPARAQEQPSPPSPALNERLRMQSGN